MMYLFGRVSFRQIIMIGVKETACHGEKMSKSHDCFCRSEFFSLCVGSFDDNGVAKLGKVITDGSVESDFSLLD